MACGRQPEADLPMAELDTGYPVWPVASMPRRLQTRPARLPPASSPIPSRFQPLFRNKSVTGHSHMLFFIPCARWCAQTRAGERWRGRRAHPEPSRNPTSVLTFSALREYQAGLLRIRKVGGRSALTKHPPPSATQPRLSIPARARRCPALLYVLPGRCHCPAHCPYLPVSPMPTHIFETRPLSVRRRRQCPTGYSESVIPTHLRVAVRGVPGRCARSEAACGDEIAIRKAECARV